MYGTEILSVQNDENCGYFGNFDMIQFLALGLIY